MEKKNKIVFKEVKQRKTVACEACRKRKQKCEGTSPCVYCVSKGIECLIGDQLKRGRKKTDDVIGDEPSNGVQTSRLVKENMQLLGNVEIRSHIRFFTKLEHLRDVLDYEQLIAPPTAAIEVLAYAISALSAQFRGQFGASIVYATKARSLVGSIFDMFEVDAAMGVLALSCYWRRTLNLNLSAHYAEIAWNLMRAIEEPNIQKYWLVFDEYINTTKTLNAAQKVELMENAILMLKRRGNHRNIIHRSNLIWMCIKSKLFKILGCDIMFPRNLSVVFLPLDNVHVSEEQRDHVMVDFIEHEKTTTLIGEHSGTHELYALCGRVQRVLIDWKSGHIDSAMAQANLCLQICSILQESNVIDLITDFAHICMLGNVTQFFYSQKCLDHAVEMCCYMKYVCGKMGPEYKSIATLVDEYSSHFLGTTTTTTASTSSDPLNTSSTAHSNDTSPFDPPTSPGPSSPNSPGSSLEDYFWDCD